MVSLGTILKGILIFSLLLVVLDTLLEVLQMASLLPDFSFLRLITDILYIIACFWTWLNILMQRLVYWDLITPLELLIKIIMVFLISMFDASFSLIFDLIAFPFHLIQDAIGDVNIPIFDDPNLFAALDLTTFTVVVGANLGTGFIGIADMQFLFQFSIFGTNALTKGNMDFAELGFLGLQVKIAGQILAQELPIPQLIFSMEDTVSSALQNLIAEYSTPQRLYEHLMDYLR